MVALVVLWSLIDRRGNSVLRAKKSFDDLRSLGINQEEIDRLENQTKFSDDDIFDQAKAKFEELEPGERPNGWEASFQALAKLLTEARTKGYQLGFMLMPEPVRHHLISDERRMRVEEVRNLSYDRSTEKSNEPKIAELENLDDAP